MTRDFLNQIAFHLAGQDFTIGQVGVVLLTAIAIFITYRLCVRYLLQGYLMRREIPVKDVARLGKLLRGFLVLLFSLLLILILRLDRTLLTQGTFDLTISHILKAMVFFYGAMMLDWAISNIFIHSSFIKRDRERVSKSLYNVKSEKSAQKIVQSIFYVLVALYVIRNFQLDFTFYEHEFRGEVLSFKLSNIFVAILIILLARLFVWVLIQLVLYNVYKAQKVDQGAQYAVNQLLKYVVYVIAIIMALQTLGLNITLLIGGAAALLVGVGLGLQQTFNDFVSGIVLLFERTVSVGDILEVEGAIGTVKQIGARSSIIDTRDNISMIVPNSILVNKNVQNLTHFDDKVRFHVYIGVAYGSDADLVKRILMDIARENPFVIDYPEPFVRLLDFNNSSIDFGLYFFSRNVLVIEDIKSDIRFEINKEFIRNNVTIPFPQRDVWIRDDGKKDFSA